MAMMTAIRKAGAMANSPALNQYLRFAQFHELVKMDTGMAITEDLLTADAPRDNGYPFLASACYQPNCPNKPDLYLK